MLLNCSVRTCVLLNSDGYYDDLFKFLDHAVAEELLKERNRASALQAPSAATALQIIQAAWARKEDALTRTFRAYRR